jgi:hypothetical protein
MQRALNDLPTLIVKEGQKGLEPFRLDDVCLKGAGDESGSALKSC